LQIAALQIAASQIAASQIAASQILASPSSAYESGADIIDHHPLNDNQSDWYQEQDTLNDLIILYPCFTDIAQRGNDSEHQ
jgi:hypothetical protein